MSTPSPPVAVLRRAAHLGRRHGKAAVYWQIGDCGSNAALEFYCYLPCGDAEITGLFEMPRLAGRQDREEPTAPALLTTPRLLPFRSVGEVSS